MSRRREVLLVTALAVVTTIVMTYPLTFQLGTGGRVDSEDGQFSVWNIAWVAHAMGAAPTQLFHANIFYPHRNTLAFSEANLVAGTLAVPPYWLTRNPYIAHNSVVLLSFMLALVGTYALVKYLTGSPAAAAVSGVLFAFCPFVFARSAHIQLLMTAGLPFSMLAFHRLADSPTVGRGIALGLILAVTGLACGYYGLFAGLMVGVSILFYAVVFGRWRKLDYWSAIGVAVLTGAVITGACFIPYMEVASTHGAIARTLDDARMYSADWRAYLASPARSHRWLLERIEFWNEVLFPGFVSLGLSVIGLTFWRPTHDATRTSAPRRGPRLQPGATLYALIGLLAWWASLGPSGGLYTLLFNIVPGFGMLRAPARLGITVALCLAVLAGYGVTRLAAGRRAVGVAALVMLVALVELAAIPYPHYQGPRYPAAYDMLARLPPGSVAEFPYFSDRMEFPRHTYYMMGSTIHWQPLINGYSDLIPQDFRAEAESLAQFPTEEAFVILERHETRYVVLHRQFYEAAHWASLDARLAGFSDRLRLILQDQNARLYEIVY